MTLPQLHELRAQASLNAARYEEWLKSAKSAAIRRPLISLLENSHMQYNRIQELINVSDDKERI